MERGEATTDEHGSVSDLLQSLSRRSVEEILAVLEAAIEEHQAWLQRWHRSVVCKLQPSSDLVSENAHYLCRFGSWYDLHGGAGIVDQPAFDELGDAHRLMHDHGRWLAARAWKDSRVPAEEYEAFMAKVVAFQGQARRLERAFRAALSDLDPLTGVHNRKSMLAELAREQDRAQRTHQPCCFALGDLDHFKQINDRYGHVVGDRVLLAAAGSFLSSLRPYDSLFRYGGEEFLFCLPDTALDQAQRTLDRLRQRLAEQPIEVEDGERVQVTVSFGIALAIADVPIETLIERADRALYEAKQQGRNRVEVWREDLPTNPVA